jgi:hypothetical protein
MEAPHASQPVRGWLAVLCVWLALWQPLSLAFAAAEALAALPVRGWPLGLLLVARLVVTAIGLAAARAVWERRPGAPALTRAAIVLSGVSQLLVYATSIAPNNRVPGDTPLYVVATVIVHAGWMMYLARSNRVRSIFE